MRCPSIIRSASYLRAQHKRLQPTRHSRISLVSCAGEPLKRSAAEPQPKDAGIGFAACCEDAAMPFRIAPFRFWASPSPLKIM